MNQPRLPKDCNNNISLVFVFHWPCFCTSSALFPLWWLLCSRVHLLVCKMAMPNLPSMTVSTQFTQFSVCTFITTSTFNNITNQIHSHCTVCMQYLFFQQAHWDSKHSKLPFPDYAAQYTALKDAKRAAQKAKGTSSGGKGKKAVGKKSGKR